MRGRLFWWFKLFCGGGAKLEAKAALKINLHFLGYAVGDAGNDEANKPDMQRYSFQ
jgi:hypothetical protein